MEMKCCVGHAFKLSDFPPLSTIIFEKVHPKLHDPLFKRDCERKKILKIGKGSEKKSLPFSLTVRFHCPKKISTNVVLSVKSDFIRL